MSRPIRFRATIHLQEYAKSNIDRMWNNLMALDVVILEEHTKAGVLITETDSDDLERLQAIPGVLAVAVEANPKSTLAQTPRVDRDSYSPRSRSTGTRGKPYVVR